MRIFKEYKYSRQEKFFIFYFPIVSAVFFSFIDVIPESYHIDIVRGIFSFFAIFYFLGRNRLILDKAGKTLLTFTLFVIIMTMVTILKYNYLDKVVFKVVIASFFYFWGFNYINNYKNFVLLLNAFYYSLIIVLSSLVILKILGIEMPDQYRTEIELGAQGVNTTKILPILFLPLFVKIKLFKLTLKQRLLHYAIITVSIIIILLGMKRGAVLGLSFAFLSYILLSAKKGKTFRFILILSILFVLLSSFLGEYITKAYEFGSERYRAIQEEKFYEEARYYETMVTLDNISFENPFSSFFGHGFKSEFFVYSTTRMFHTDYMTLLHGTGILGLFLYLLFYVRVVRIVIKKGKVDHHFKDLMQETKAVNVALIVYLLFVGISGAIHDIDLRGFALLFGGGSIRFKLLALSDYKEKYFIK